jgi:tetratricopeptide (TPR) repeat protein
MSGARRSGPATEAGIQTIVDGSHSRDELGRRWDALTSAAYAIPHDRIDEREPLLIERLRVAQALGADGDRLEQSHANLLHYYYCDTGDRRKVEVACRYWLALKQDRVTASSHDLHVLMELGSALSILGRADEAGAQYRRALRLAEEAHGVGDRETYAPLYQLAQHLHNANRHDEAAELGERLLAMRQNGQAGRWDQPPWFLRASYRALGRLSDVERLIRDELTERQQRAADERDPRPGMLMRELADAVAAQGRLDEALTINRDASTQISAAYDAMIERHERWRADAEAQGQRTAGPISRMLDIGVRGSYAALLRQTGRLAEAEAIYRDILAIQQAEPEESPLMPGLPAVGRALRAASRGERRSTVLADLAAVIREAGRAAEAEPLAAEADALAACAATIRARVDRIWERRAALREREELVSVAELRRLLAVPA